MSLHRGAVGLLGQAVDERRDTAGTFAEEIRSSGDGARLGVTVGANHAAGGEDDLGDHAAALPAKDNETDLAALLDAAATEVVPQQPACQRGGKGPAGLQPSGGVDPAVTYASLSTQARAHYEKYKDTERAKPLVTARKRARPGQFNSYRLLTLQDFVNNVDGSGLSAAGKNQLFNLLDVWCRTKPGMPVDDGHNEELRDRFKTPHAFRKALADDLDEAVLSEGWLSCNLREFGVDHEGYYRPCLPVIVSAASSGTRVHLWSGGDGVAPPTNMRETPLDGDAFRECEADVVARHGSRAFVAGIHVSSDCMVLSGSGGTYLTDSSSSWGPRLTRVPVSELRARPGLADVGPLLGLSAPGALVSVATHLSFTGELDGGKPIEQLVRASPNFRGAAWYDHVLYRVDVAGAAMQRYGQVMALVRPPDGGDVAVVVKMVRVDADESPLSARGCVRLRWDLEDGAAVATEGARVRLDLVRLTALLQVVHVVPDFAALLRRRGIGAEPVELGQGVDGLEEMVYLHNVFYPARPHKRRGAGGQ